MPKELTDKAVKALKLKDKPYEAMDALIRGFGVRVMPSGQKSFILVKRFPGSDNPVRRTLGSYRASGGHDGDLTLAEARAKAGDWNRMVKQGLDPAVEAARQRQEKLKAERQQKENTFGNAFEIYVRDRLSKQRTGGEIERTVRKDLGNWMDLPLAAITQADVKTAIRSFKDKPAKAHAVFTALRTFCNWIVDSGDFNLAVSPCNGIKPTVLIGERNVRNRVLKDCELAAYWRASEMLGYPFGKFCQLLALTALRRDEAANAEWSEFDLGARLWVIPAERMKGKEGKAKPHAIPLTNDIVSLLETLPRFVGGGFLFSTTSGCRPISGFSKVKARLDGLMRADLEKQGWQFESFTIHDIRRTCRTRFSALPVEHIVRELLLAHAQPGLHKVYDLHAYEQEKRRALELWHSRLGAIVEPKGMVIPLDRLQTP